VKEPIHEARLDIPNLGYSEMKDRLIDWIMIKSMGASGTLYGKGLLEAVFDEIIALLAIIVAGFGVVIVFGFQVYIWFSDGEWVRLSALEAMRNFGWNVTGLFPANYIGLHKAISRILGLPFSVFLVTSAALLPAGAEFIKAEIEKVYRGWIALSRWCNRAIEKFKKWRDRLISCLQPTPGTT